MSSYSVVIAPMALECLQDIESYKSATLGAAEAALLAERLLMDSIKAISEDPERYRFNAHLASRGLMLRERLDVSSEYRLLYDFDGSVIEILLLISMKQDIEKQLYRHSLLR